MAITSNRWTKVKDGLPKVGQLVKVMYKECIPYDPPCTYEYDVREFTGMHNGMWLCDGCSVIAWKVPTKADLVKYWGIENGK